MAESTSHRLQQRRRVWTGVVAIAALFSQLTTILMAALPATEKKEVTVWTEAETTALVDYLVEHRAEAGDGGNFKAASFNNAAKHIAPLLNRGLVKTAKTIKTKWSGVSNKHVS